MFMIVALVYIVSPGLPPDEPFRVPHTASYISLERCQEHLTSPEFANQKQLLAQMISDGLVRTGAAPSVQPVITASCEPDNRI